MEISRILRVLIILMFVVTFIASTMAAYRQNRQVQEMTTLSDATTSIASDLSTRTLVKRGAENNPVEYMLDKDKLDNEKIDFKRKLTGQTFEYKIKLEHFSGGQDAYFDNSPPGSVMKSSISVPVTVAEGREPAKLEVVAWYS